MEKLNPFHWTALLRRRFNPFHLGLATWLAMVTYLAAMLALTVGRAAYPSANLMQTFAQIAATLLVGWVVMAVWMVARVERDGDDREEWLGGTTGLGVGGLAGLAVALLVAAHREAGHANFLDRFGCWWAVISIGALGLMLVLHPLVVERWRPDQT